MVTASVALCQEPGPAAARTAIADACARLARPARTVVLFATHAHEPRALLTAARAATSAHVIGCAASGVIAGAVEVEEGPAVAALAFGDEETLVPFMTGGPAEVAPPAGGGCALVFADGYSRHPDELVSEATAAWQGL